MPSPTPNPDSQPVTGKIVSDSANNAHVQRDTLAPDQGKPDLSQHEAWQNQHSTSFPDPRLNSDASSTTYGAQPGENGETPVSSSSITGHHERANLPQPDPNVPHQFPNPHESSGTLSSHQVNPDPSLQTNSSNNTHVQSGTFSGGGPGQHVDGLDSDDSSSTSPSFHPRENSGLPPHHQMSPDASLQADPSGSTHVQSGTFSGGGPGQHVDGLGNDYSTTSTSPSPSVGVGATDNSGTSGAPVSSPTSSGSVPTTSGGGGSPSTEPAAAPTIETAETSAADYSGGEETSSEVTTGTPVEEAASNTPSSNNTDPGQAPGLVDNSSHQCVAESSDIHGADPVPYDEAASDALAAALRKAKDAVHASYGAAASGGGARDNLPQREIWDDFKGRYADDAHNCHNNLATNAYNVALMLDHAAELVDYLKSCAEAENKNREAARKDDEKWWIQKKWDELWGNKIKYTSPSKAKPSTPASAPAPAPVASSGTDKSSANPDKIDTYVKKCNDDTSGSEGLETSYNNITGALQSFEAGCKYGTLDIRPALSGLSALNSQSNQVMTWLTNVAQAFRDANNGAGGLITVSDAYLDQQMQARGMGTPNIQHIDATASEVYGEIPSSGYANDPVNVATGNFIEPETDLVFADTMSSTTLSLRRMYNSLAVTNPDETPSGVFGPGWSSTVDTQLQFSPEHAGWVKTDGRLVFFDRAGDGFARAQREPLWLLKVTAADELYECVRDAQTDAYEQARTVQASAATGDTPDATAVKDETTGVVSFFWMVTNNTHEAYFYTPLGEPVAYRNGHLGSLTVFVRDENGRVQDLVHPVAHRGIHLDYEITEETGKVHPVAAFTYNTVGTHAGKPVHTVTYTYTQAPTVHENVSTEAAAEATDYPEQVSISDPESVTTQDSPANTSDSEHAVLSETSKETAVVPSMTGLLTGVRTAEGTRTYTHTQQGLIHRVVNARGDVEVTNTYDESGRVIAQVSEYGREIAYTYTSNLTTIIADAGTGENANLWVSDNKGRLVSVTATDGTRQTMSYDRFSNRVSITERDGSRLVRTSDARGHIRRERTPEGADYTYEWDEQDKLVQVSVRDARDPRNLGEPVTLTSYRYDSSALTVNSNTPTVAAVVNPYPVELINGAEQVTQIEYSACGDVVRVTDPTGVYTAFEYDEHHDVISMHNPAGDTIRLIRDIAGRVVSVVNPLGAATTLEYTAAGALRSVTDPAGARWMMQYPNTPVGDGVPYMVRAQGENQRQGLIHSGAESADAAGVLPEAIIDPSGAVARLTYTAGGDIASITDAAGNITQHEYDTFGNLVKLITAQGRVWEYSWDGLSQLVGVTDPSGAKTTFEYDAAGEPVSMTDPTGVVSRRVMNRHEGTETVAGTIEGVFSSAFYTLDVLGRVTEIRENAGDGIKGANTAGGDKAAGTQMFTYDAASRVVEALDAAGGLTTYTRDAAGRVTRVVSAAGRFTDYAYDACGRVVSESVGLNVPTRVTDPVTGAQTWEEPTRWAVTTLVYDAASQVIQRTGPDGLVEAMEYDTCGRLVRVNAGARVASYAYDVCGRVTMVQDSTFGTRRYAYDSTGQLVQVTDGLGHRTFFTYDVDGLLTQVTDPTGLITRYAYDATGRVVEVIREPHQRGTSATGVERTRYTYDAAGRVLSQDDGVRTRTFEYDPVTGDLARAMVDGMLAAEYGITDGVGLDRAAWVKDHTGSAPVMYRSVWDAQGNLLRYTRCVTDTETAVQPPAAGSAAALDAFTRDGSYTLEYSYDADGYRTGRISPYGATQWVLDGIGQPVRATTTATSGEPVVAEFSYDVAGHLIRAQVAETISQWEFNTDGLVSAYQRTTCEQDQNVLVEGVQIIRDNAGRIIGLDTADAGLVMYTYDAAGQLTGARWRGYELVWEYQAGLMVAERLYERPETHDESTADAGNSERVLLGERVLSYNGLNQLVHAITTEHTTGETQPVVTKVSYTYNAAGQRVSQTCTTSGSPAVQERAYTWGITGALAAVTTHDTSTGVSSRVQVVTDMSGAVVEVTGTDGLTVPLLWDSVATAPQLLGAGSIPAAGTDGGFSQAGVLGGFNPWGVPGVPTTGVGFGALNIPGVGGIGHTAGAYQTLGVSALTGSVGVTASGGVFTSSGLPQGVSFTGSGTVAIGELTLMGARVFDPASKKFLSQDPLPPVVGAGWFADAYSFVGHDPIGLVDPWGTRPISLEEYNTYKTEQQVKGWLTVVGTVITVASLFIPGGPLVVASVAALGGAFMGAADGFKFNENGGIDWGSTFKGAGWGAAIGFVSGGMAKVFTASKVAGAFSKFDSKLASFAAGRGPLANKAAAGAIRFSQKLGGETGSKYVAGALGGGASNATSSTLTYLKTSENPSLGGALTTAGTSFVTGATSSLGGTWAQQKIQAVGANKLPSLFPKAAKAPDPNQPQGFLTGPAPAKPSLAQRIAKGTTDELSTRAAGVIPGGIDSVTQDSLANHESGKQYTTKDALNSFTKGARNKAIGDPSNPIKWASSNPIVGAASKSAKAYPDGLEPSPEHTSHVDNSRPTRSDYKDPATSNTPRHQAGVEGPKHRAEGPAK